MRAGWEGNTALQELVQRATPGGHHLVECVRVVHSDINDTDDEWRAATVVSGAVRIPSHSVEVEKDSGTAESGTENALTDTDKAWTVDEHIGRSVRITGGTGAGQKRPIVSNTADMLTVNAWATTPDATSTYKIIEHQTSGDGSIRINGTPSVLAIGASPSETQDAITDLDDLSPLQVVEIRWKKANAERMDLSLLMAKLDPNRDGTGVLVKTWVAQLFRIARYTDEDEAVVLEQITMPVRVTAGTLASDVIFNFGRAIIGEAPENATGQKQPFTVIAIWALREDGTPAGNVAWIGDTDATTITVGSTRSTVGQETGQPRRTRRSWPRSRISRQAGVGSSVCLGQQGTVRRRRTWSTTWT